MNGDIRENKADILKACRLLHKDLTVNCDDASEQPMQLPGRMRSEPWILWLRGKTR
jgi:translation initiation factor IF-1